MYIYTIHLCMYSRGEKEGGWSGGVGGLTREDIWAQPRCSSLYGDPPRIRQFRRVLQREELFVVGIVNKSGQPECQGARGRDRTSSSIGAHTLPTSIRDVAHETPSGIGTQAAPTGIGGGAHGTPSGIGGQGTPFGIGGVAQGTPFGIVRGARPWRLPIHPRGIYPHVSIHPIRYRSSPRMRSKCGLGVVKNRLGVFQAVCVTHFRL